MNFFINLKNSAVAMTWLSYFAKSFQLVFMAPLASIYLSPNELNYLLVILTILGLGYVADMGFTPTISRVFAQIRGVECSGFIYSEFYKLANGVGNKHDHLKSLDDASHEAYIKLSIISSITLVFVGTIFIIPSVPVDASFADWGAWVVVLFTMPPIIYFKRYMAFFEGAGKIAILGRLKTVFLGLSASVLILAMLAEAPLVILVAVVQASELALGFYLKRYYERNEAEFRSGEGVGSQFLKTEYARYIFSRSWKSGLGLIMGFSVFQLSGLVYSSLAESSEKSAALLMALRLFQAARQFSNVPFYTALPKMNSLYVNGEIGRLLEMAKSRQMRSISIFVLIGLAVMVCGSLTDVVVLYPTLQVWSLIVVAGVIERYGAMHLQLYTLSGDVIWHKVNGYTALSFVVFSVFLSLFSMDVAIPIAMLISYIIVYTRMSCKKSAGKYGFSILKYDFGTPVLGCLVLICVSIIVSSFKFYIG